MKPIFLCLALAFMPVALPSAGAASPMLRKQLMELPADERQKYEVAFEKAMVSPEVTSVTADRKAANEELNAARRAAVLAKDPLLSGLLDKAAPVDEAGGQRPATLTPEERKKLAEVYSSVRGDAAVRSAQKKAGDVQKRYRDTLNAALLAADPELKPIIEKLQPPKKAEKEVKKEAPATPAK